jgi:potassium efflux system protein
MGFPTRVDARAGSVKRDLPRPKPALRPRIQPGVMLVRVRPWLGLIAIACAVAASAQEAASSRMDKAPVVLDGRVLFEVGASGTWSAARRAAEINRILRRAVAEPEPTAVLLAEHDGYPTIRMGDWHLVTVTDSDVVPGMDPGEQAERWLQAVDAALGAARRERTPAYTSAAAGLALALIALAAALCWLIRRARRRLPIWLARQRGAAGVQAQSGSRPPWQLAVELACLAAEAGIVIAVLARAADLFPTARQWRYGAAAILGASLRAPLFTMNDRAYSIVDLAWVLGAVGFLWVSVGAVTRVLSDRVQRATGAPAGAVQPFATLTRYGLIGVGVIVILQIAGLNLSSLALVASVVGVGIGFGLQSIANNFVSGLILSFERPIKPGDFVSLGAWQGTVQRIGARSTVIRTLDRVSILVPNARLLENEVVNWSYGDELVRLHVPVGVAYGSDPHAVRTALLAAARAHPAVLADPRPEVRHTGFGESALQFALLVWIRDPARQREIESDLYYRLNDALRHAGIEIPFPHRTLHIAHDDIDVLAARLSGRMPDGVQLYDPHGAPATAHRNGHGGGHAPAPAVGQPHAPAPAVDIENVAARMRAPGGVPIADRRHLLTVYRACFVGSDAVGWLMRALDIGRDDAIRIGQSLVERRIVHHVLDEHPFRDGNFFYRFYADEPAPAVAVS